LCTLVVSKKILGGSDLGKERRLLKNTLTHYRLLQYQGCQMVHFHTKHPNLGIFWGLCYGKVKHIL
jgi:hypothetical protein